MLEERLMKHARIDKSILFMGAGKQIKIWAEEVFNERENNRDLSYIRSLMSTYKL